jgi:hypothetical protein
MKNLIFTSTVKESTALSPEQAFYKLFRNQKNLDYTTTDLLSLGRCKADICDLPLKTINMMSFYVITF